MGKYITINIDGRDKIVYKKVREPVWCYIDSIGLLGVHLVDIESSFLNYTVSPQEFKTTWKACIKRRKKRST